MRWTHHFTLVSLVVIVIITSPSLFDRPAIAGSGPWEAGIRAGWSFSDDKESFNQYDMVFNHRLPWRWVWGGSLQVDTNLTTSVGVLEGGRDAGLVGSAGFQFLFKRARGQCPLELRAGSALTLLSETKFGDQDFGGPVQFTHHISLHYWIMEDLNALARVQHMSNAGIYDDNPGLNLVMLGLVYRF